MRHSTIQFREHTVTKTAAPSLMNIEVEKTRRARQISSKCGLFRVPAVLEYDEPAGTAIFERIQGIAPIEKTVPWGKQYDILAKDLGISLAVIHRELALPEEMRVPLPDAFALGRNEVFIHGDLTVDNVCMDRAGTQIVILDWQMTPLYGGQATFGTRYFDVFWFIGTLLNRPKTRFLFSNPVAPVARIFMESYFQEAGLTYDTDEVSRYAKRFFEVEIPRVKQEIIRNSKGRARLLWPRCQAMARAFVESLGK
jgi:hypothetical protein